MKCEEVLEAKN